MPEENLLDSPIAAMRVFGIIIPAMVDEDREGAAAALHYATRLAADLERWRDYPYRGRDAAFNRLAIMVRQRTSTTALNTHDVMLLANACLEAHRIGLDDDLDVDTPTVACFNTACVLIEETWANDRGERA
jgi:hypothetical protein